MRIAICWTQISGYMAACWRELAKNRGIVLLVITTPGGGIEGNSPFTEDLSRGFNCRFLEPAKFAEPSELIRIVTEFCPDVVHVPGWGFRSARQMVKDPGLCHVRFIMGMDNPRLDSCRQYLGGFVLKKYLSRMDRVVVPGERAWQFAKHLLKVPEHKIVKGLYGVDFDQFSACFDRRLVRMGGWPRRFLSVGRYVHSKGTDVLVEAYKGYRQKVTEPWALSCCGMGDMARLMTGVAGLEDLGFIQPVDQPLLLEKHGAFLLASRHDPWPLVVAEHCSAGLPVVCTNDCGSAVELVRSHYNGFTVPRDDVQALANAMVWIHQNYEQLPDFGKRSMQMAAPYSAKMWATRWTQMFEEVLSR